MTNQLSPIGKHISLYLSLFIFLSFMLLSACSFFSLFGGNQITGAAVVDGAIQEETQEEASQSATEAGTPADEETTSLEESSSSETGSHADADEASGTTPTTTSTTTRKSHGGGGGGGGGSSSSTLPYLDSDSDGTIDSQDRCPNYNDSVDTDADGTPDGCDAVDNGDSDNDGVINTTDVCSGFDDTVDTDADGIPDGCDPVDNGDSDSDGVINAEDICSGFDDTVDSDADGIPDGCDTSLYSYELCADNLYHGWNISYCEEDSIMGTDFDLLADGVYQDITGGIYMYTQTLEFQNQGTGQFLFTQDDDDAPLAAPYLFIDNSNVFLYNYSLIFTIPVPYDSSSEAAAEANVVGTTLEIQGIEVTITDLTLSPDGAITELTLEDSDGTTRVLRNNDEVVLNGFDTDGTLGLIYSSAPGAFYGFDISYAPDTDEVYLLEGESMLDPTFNRFFITLDSIENDDYETLEFVIGSTSAEIRFTNNDGTAVELPLAADSSYTAGEAYDEPIFWGFEAPSSTVANRDELVYLENEVCTGGTSVVDCQGAMFLVVDEDENAHLIQITNVDTNGNEMNFDDVTYGTINDNLLYTDGSLSVVSLTSAGDIIILVDESAMSITFSSIGSSDSAIITTDNGATLEIVNTDTSIQTFEGLQFYEYNDGILAFDTYLGYTSLGPLNLAAVYDDLTDNSIEWDSTALSSLGSTEGHGLFDESDENDAYQKFMTWKGTILTFDREDQLNLTIEHPTQPIYAVVLLESIEGTDLTNFDTDSDGLSDGAEIETYYTSPTDADSDGDGLSDYEEVFDSSGYDTSPTDEDTDDDGMNDRFEIVYGFDPTNSDVDTNEMLDGDDDFDADGLTNAVEQEYGINPTDTDTDSDSLTDYEEVMDYGTYANDSDSDDDGMRDGFEIAYDFDPLDADENGNEIIDGEDDEDDDFLSNAEEDAETTDPTMSDTDGDVLFDGDEVYTYLTDPLDFDTDDDELPDGMEIFGEFETDPNNADTDEDGMSDGFEVIYGFDPLIFDEDGNLVYDGADDDDGDGFTNAEEEANETDPLDPTSF